MKKTVISSAAVLLLISGCKTDTGSELNEAVISDTQTSDSADYPAIDRKFEQYYKDSMKEEQKWARVAAKTMADTVLSRPATLEQGGRNNHVLGGDKTFKRAVHPKDHGCVRAKLTVNSEDKFPKKYAKGIFKPDATYDVWLRFSNGNSNFTKPDKDGDARGLAIKVQNVSVYGDTPYLLDNNQSNQDFVMINNPAFMIDNPQGYPILVTENRSLVDNLELFGVVLADVNKTNLRNILSKKIEHPLATRYHSMSVYRMGKLNDEDRDAIKFSVGNCKESKVDLANFQDSDKENRDFLRDRLQKTLNTSSGCLDFRIHERGGNQIGKMYAETAMAVWPNPEKGTVIAKIEIPQGQNINSPERMKKCENLSFNPWHSLEAHRPLGRTNRIRKVVYEHISKLRHAKNSR